MRLDSIRYLAVAFLALLVWAPLAVFAQSLVPESVQDLCKALVFWPRSTAEYVFLVCAFAGIYAHFRNRSRLGAMLGTFYDYLLVDDKGLSVATGILIYAAVMGILSLGVIPAGIHGAAFVGIAIGGLAIGWVIDSIVCRRNV